MSMTAVLAAPVMTKDIVVVRTVDGAITALHSQTGRQLWRYYKRAPILTIRGNSSPVIFGKRVYVGFDNGKVVSLDLNTGRLMWQYTATEVRGRTELERLVDIDADPVIRSGVLYVSTYQGKLVAISLDNTRMIWSYKISAFKNIAVDDQTVYVTDEKSRIWAFNRTTGSIIWKQEKLFARKVTGSAVIGNYVVVGDYKGYLHWIQRGSGKIVARIRMDRKGYIEAPIVHNNLIITLGRSGQLAVFKIAGK